MKRFFFVVLWGVAFLAVLAAASNASIYAKASPYIYSDLSAIPPAEAVLVPGAGVYSDGSLPPIFVDRVDTAIVLYKAKKASKILVSGDNSSDTYNEVNPARMYLISKGIPAEDIFLDHAGFDTYSSMYRARAIFGVSSIIIATQSFHLPRSVFIARKLGIEAYGANADAGSILLRNNVREIFANMNAIFELMIHRVPKYLGQQIPISDSKTGNQ